MTHENLDQQAFEYLKSQVLAPGETIYWTGRPTAKLLPARHLFRVTIGVFLLAFAVSWSLVLSERGGSAWISGLFVLIAAFYLLARPYRDYRQARRAYYAITSQRVIIILAGKTFRDKSLYAPDIRSLQQTKNGDGTVDLQLRSRTIGHAEDKHRIAEFEDGLWGITDGEAAANAIETLLRDA